eukprot:Gb_03985 [translate_table: standard]
MQGNDFEIVYKKGKDNIVVDALSRKEEGFTLCHVTSGSFLAGRSKVRMATGPKHEAKDIGLTRKKVLGKFTWKSNTLFDKGRIYLSSHSKLKKKVLEASHSAPTVDHSGFLKTYQCVK